MAIVLDPNDPNGMGMFSKTGRVTSAKYTVFQRRAEIMENKQRFLKVTSMPVLGIDLDTKDTLAKEFLEDKQENTNYSLLLPKKKGAVPFSQQLSREEIEKLGKNKRPPPPTGFYNPKYNYVQRSTNILFNYNKEKPRPASSGRPSTSLSENDVSSPEKSKKKVSGPTPFKFQIGRDYFYKADNNPHEDEFVYRDFPQSFSKSKQVPSINIKKTVGRDRRVSSSSMLCHPHYDPNYEVGRRQLGSSGPAFDKRIGRKSIEHISWSTNDNFFDISKNEELKFPRSKNIDFGKTLSREWSSTNSFSNFFQKKNSSRLFAKIINQKIWKLIISQKKISANKRKQYI